MLGEQFLSELHTTGVSPDEAVEMHHRVFGILLGAARLFVDSHPSWASEITANDSDESITPRYYAGCARSNRT
jgi:hypothetical protein